MHRLRFTFLAIALLLLSACATPIQVQDYHEDFATTWQSTNRFTVSYRINPNSTEQIAIDLALLRSAEVALNNGFHYFIVANADDSSIGIVEPASSTKVIAESAQPYRLGNPAATNLIIGFQEKPPGFHYVALFVKASLRTRYDLDRARPSI
jgi:hypothetical protein